MAKKRGRPSRPGAYDWQTWVPMRAVMNVHGIRPKAAAAMLVAKRSKGAGTMKVERDGTMTRWHPRSVDSLRLAYHEAERRRARDPEMASDCEYWLPVFELAEREGLTLADAMKRLGLI